MYTLTSQEQDEERPSGIKWDLEQMGVSSLISRTYLDRPSETDSTTKRDKRQICNEQTGKRDNHGR
jgi:hypothetical protein